MGDEAGLLALPAAQGPEGASQGAPWLIGVGAVAAAARIGCPALHPFDPQDHALLKAVNCGEFTLIGIRNRDLQELLYATPAKTKLERRRRSPAISRKLRLQRAHGLIHKLPHTHRYMVGDNGRLILNAILSAHRATIRQFMAPVAPAA
jgi:hypothetical protein